jgi:opacity protein-like surface antigen
LPNRTCSLRPLFPATEHFAPPTVLWSMTMNRILVLGAVCIVLVVLGAAPAAAQFAAPDPPTVQIAGFAGYQFGGSIQSALLDRKLSFKSDLDYGGSLDLAIGKTWRFEVYYSRHDTELEGEGLNEVGFDVKIERLMAGFLEEKGRGSVKYFGSILVGATRYTPGPAELSDDTRFSAGLGLGVKSFFSENFGLRLEGHVFYTSVQSGGGIFCTDGECVFRYSGSGIWQGDVAAGLFIAF